MKRSFRILGYKPFEDIVSVPRVDAEAKIKPEKEKIDKSASGTDIKETSDEESSDSESEEGGEGEDTKKKRVKEKVGFRDRKVIIFTYWTAS